MRKLDKVFIGLYVVIAVFAIMSIVFTLLAGEVSVVSHCLADGSIILLVLNLIMTRISNHIELKNQADKNNSDETKEG